MVAYIKASADATSTSTAYVSLRGMGSYSAETRKLEWIFTDPNGNEKTFADNDIASNASQTPDKTITGLAAGTTYTITAHVYVHIGGSTWWDSYFDKFQDGSTAQITTKSSTPTLTCTADKYQIYVRVNNPPGTGTRYCHWYCSTSSSDYGDEISVQTITGNIAQTSDLTLKQARGNSSTYLILPSTKYYIKALIKNSSNSTLNTLYTTITTGSTEISAFIWTGKNYTSTTSNPAATAAQTKAAKTALDNLGKTEDFSYLVWNDMVRKCNDIRSARGLSWNSTYATLANTKMTSSEAGRTLTATRFNSLRYNIGDMYSTGINTVAAGDTVKASYFTTLVTKMNAVR